MDLERECIGGRGLLGFHLVSVPSLFTHKYINL
jgi:hypothetical protein